MTDGTDLRAAAAPQEGGASAGAMLRAAREAQGMSLDDMAIALKVVVKKLELIEADRYEELHDPTFARALMQAACRLLKVDPAPMLARMPQRLDGGLAQVTRGIDEPFRGRAAPMAHADAAAAFGLAPMLIVGALIVGAIALALLPKGTLESWTAKLGSTPQAASAADDAGNAASAQDGFALGTSQTSVTPLPPGAFDSGAGAPSDGASAVPMPSAAPAPTTAAATTAPAAATLPSAGVAAAPASLAAPAAGTASLQFQAASQPSWLTVSDASGARLIHRSVSAGETVALDGTPPLRVVVGNASASSLSFRGQSVDLAASAVGNVARIELK